MRAGRFTWSVLIRVLLRAAGLSAAFGLGQLIFAQDVHVRVSPDVKTGIEGTTEFPTIQMAMDHHPFAGVGADGKPGRVYIEIAPGVYHERVIVTQNHTNITLVGMGKSSEDVVITNSLNAKQAGGTFFTETVEINGDGFEADNLTFENTAGNTGQAVAAAVRADRAVFKHCRFLGHQDTLFADFGRQYYVDSYIEGGVDFIFGNATAVFDHSEIHANGPGYLTAQSRTSPEQTTGYVIVDSKVTSGIAQGAGPDAAMNATGNAAINATGQPNPEAPRRDTICLGRPWRPYARVVYIHTELPADVIPQGWSAWGNRDPVPLAYYAEFESTGPGANATARVAWSHQLTAKEAAKFMPKVFLAGKDHWDPVAAAGKLP
jgi:pectinesterase